VLNDETSFAPRAPIDDATLIRRTCRGRLVIGQGAMREALAVLDRVAASSCTVLVTGESGTGKELAVAALHDKSPRADKPLVAVNCGAVPENLVEAELFGHARGAFTGANAARQGLVAAAEGGTLFLDEVGELPLSAQVKLLRLIQAREYTPVGETRVLKANVRIVAATHRDLAAEVAARRFREDLYYRLNVIHVRLPALRDRREDIPILARWFLHACNEREGRQTPIDFSPAAIAALTACSWPGNIRALENAVERAALLAAGPTIEVEEILPSVDVEGRAASTSAPADEARASPPPPITGAVAPAPRPERRAIDLRAEVEAYENRLIQSALLSAGWNKTRAAQLLGLHRTTLVEMLKRKRIDQAVPAGSGEDGALASADAAGASRAA
jgi:DNA-binding NtrC family response regulator